MTQDNVIKFSQPGTYTDPLTEILRHGARALLAHAVEAEVAGFLRRRGHAPAGSVQQPGRCRSLISRSGKCPWRTTRWRPSDVSLAA